MSYKNLFFLESGVETSTFQARDYAVKQATMVNHSGEIGAKQIYLGQIKAIKSKNIPQKQDHVNKLIQMLEHEVKHYEYFKNCIESNINFKPSCFDVIWKSFSFYLGYCTAFCSIEIAMLLTKSVETIIEKHYSKFLNY